MGGVTWTEEWLASDPGTCSIARTLDLVGEKWTLLVLREAFNGVRRFEVFLDRLGAPRQVLSSRLSRLVEAGILDRVPYREPGQRTRHEYRLTAPGRDLQTVLVALMRYGDRHLAGPAGPPVELLHAGCGQPVDAVLACAAGHRLDRREIEPRHGRGARLAS
jgi:DNA-binding HxlR family transcriptional regulator